MSLRLPEQDLGYDLQPGLRTLRAEVMRQRRPNGLRPPFGIEREPVRAALQVPTGAVGGHRERIPVARAGHLYAAGGAAWRKPATAAEDAGEADRRGCPARSIELIAHGR